jgi:hypothetical protein
MNCHRDVLPPNAVRGVVDACCVQGGRSYRQGSARWKAHLGRQLGGNGVPRKSVLESRGNAPAEYPLRGFQVI